MEELLSQMMKNFNLNREEALERLINEQKNPTREDYVNTYPGSKKDLANKIFDYLEYIKTPDFDSIDVLVQLDVMNDLQKLINERDRGFIDEDDPDGFLRH